MVCGLLENARREHGKDQCLPREVPPRICTSLYVDNLLTVKSRLIVNGFTK